jgi:hypothetical protein
VGVSGIEPVNRKENFFIICGFLCALTFCFLYYISTKKNLELSAAYSTISKTGRKTFSVIKDFHINTKTKTPSYLYTYRVADEHGKFHENTEEVDKGINNKLRVGDTVVCFQKTIYILGQETIISRIEGNQAPAPNLNFIITYSKIGLYFSGLLFFAGIIKKIISKFII